MDPFSHLALQLSRMGSKPICTDLSCTATWLLVEAGHGLLVVILHWSRRKLLARARPAFPQMMTWSSRAVNCGIALGNQAVLDAGLSLTALCLLAL